MILCLKMKIVRIDKGRIIPVSFAFVGTLLVGLLYMLAFNHYTGPVLIISWIMLSPLVPFLWTTRQILEINPNEDYVDHFFWFLGFKSGKKEVLGAIDYIFINQNNYSQTATSYGGNVSQFKSRVYQSYLKCASGQKILLITRKDKQKLMESLIKISEKLNTSIIDQTNE